MVKVTIGEKIKAKRKELKKTQEDIAKATGISRVMITKYETGKAYPTLDAVFKLSDALDLPVEYLGNDCFSSVEEYKQYLEATAYESPETLDLDEFVPDEMTEVYSQALSKMQKACWLLNDAGIEKLLERVDELLSMEKYRNTDHHIYPPEE